MTQRKAMRQQQRRLEPIEPIPADDALGVSRDDLPSDQAAEHGGAPRTLRMRSPLTEIALRTKDLLVQK